MSSSAGALDGKSVTCDAGIRDDIRLAAGAYRDEGVIVDGTLITARGNDDLPEFCEQIGRGGFMLEPEKDFKEGKKFKFIIIDRSENMKLNIKAICRYADIRRAGFEFDGLDVDSAVEIGILIGKYYQTDAIMA